MILMFGQYKNHMLTQVPSSYLRRLVETNEDIELIQRATEELEKRDEYDNHFEESDDEYYTRRNA